jgi:two-component system response regulator FixJ
VAAERTVHVVDNDAGVRRSLERLLDSAGFRAVAYETPMSFLAAAPGLSSGCVLLDVRMPGMDGLTLQARLEIAVWAMKLGAVDFIEKPYDDDVLIKAIELALSLPRQSDRNQEVAEAAKRVAALSRRERQVLDGLVAGRPNKLIAYDLGISVRTVEVHRARMMERLAVRQLAEAIRLAVMARLASPDQ